jgi:hypothetical protein
MKRRECFLLFFGATIGWLAGFQRCSLCTSDESAQRQIGELTREVLLLRAASTQNKPAEQVKRVLDPTPGDAPLLKKLEQSTFCSGSKYDISTNERAQRIAVDGSGGKKYLPYPPKFFCPHIEENLDLWDIAPKNLTVNDVVVGIFSGNKVAFGRGLAMKNAWLSRFPLNYLYTPVGNDAVGVVGLDKYSFKSDLQGIVARAPLLAHHTRASLLQPVPLLLANLHPSSLPPFVASTQNPPTIPPHRTRPSPLPFLLHEHTV